MSQIKVGLFFEASNSIGTGHLVRSIEVGKALHKYGADVLFFTSSEMSGIRSFDSISDATIRLPDHSDPGFQEKLRSLVRSKGIEWCVFDLLEDTLDHFRFIASIGCKTAAIWSFLYSGRPRFEDIVIYPDIDVHEVTDGGSIRFFSGAEYLSINERCVSLEDRKFGTNPLKIMVTMGGSDGHRISEKVIAAMNFVESNVSIQLVIGPLMKDRKELYALAGSCRHHVTLIESCSDLSGIMKSSDLAIINGGLTRYELAAAGTPFIALSLHHTQFAITERMASKGACINAGVYDAVSEQDIASAVDRLCRDARALQRMSDIQRGLVDGRGSERIARLILDPLNRDIQ